VARSQLALRLGLALYAALCTAVALRTVVLLLGFPGSVETVGAIVSISDPIVAPLKLVPGAARPVVGSATLADLTTAVILLAVPMPFLGRREA
jgi:hypothetical protein